LFGLKTNSIRTRRPRQGMIWAAKYVAFTILNGVLVVRKLSYLRGLRDSSEFELSTDDNAQRLFAIVGLSLACVTKIITVALVIVFGTADVKKHLENVRIGAFCWALLSAMTTLWSTIEAFYRSLSLRRMRAMPLPLKEEEATSSPGVIMVSDDSEDSAESAEFDEQIAKMRKEMYISWLFALIYAAVFVFCVFKLVKKLKLVKNAVKRSEKEQKFAEQAEFEEEELKKATLERLFHGRNGMDSGFNSENSSSATPSTSISTISSCGNGKGMSPRRYTDIDESELTNSYPSGSMQYPADGYPGPPGHRYNEISDPHWQKVQMNQQLTKEHLMARCTGTFSNPNGQNPGTAKTTPGLDTLLRNGARKGPVKYEDSRQYELRKTLPRNSTDTGIAFGKDFGQCPAQMKMEQRPPSKEKVGTLPPWNQIPAYIQSQVPPTQADHVSRATTQTESYRTDSINTDESVPVPMLPKVLSDQLERAYHLDKKLSKVLEQAEEKMRRNDSLKMNHDSLLRKSRPDFRTVPNSSSLESANAASIATIPNIEASLPRPETSSKLPPINNFRPNVDNNNNNTVADQPPIPVRNHPGHYRCGMAKELVQIGPKSSSKTGSVEGTISRSMSFGSLNSKDSNFSRDSLKRSSLKSASLASGKKKVRWGNFQEEFTPYEVQGLSKKRNTPIKQ